MDAYSGHQNAIVELQKGRIVIEKDIHRKYNEFRDAIDQLRLHDEQIGYSFLKSLGLDIGDIIEWNGERGEVCHANVDKGTPLHFSMKLYRKDGSIGDTRRVVRTFHNIIIIKKKDGVE